MLKYLIYFVRWVLLLLDSKAFDRPTERVVNVIYEQPEVLKLKHYLHLEQDRPEHNKIAIERARKTVTEYLSDFVTVIKHDKGHGYDEIELRLTVAVIPEKEN